MSACLLQVEETYSQEIIDAYEKPLSAKEKQRLEEAGGH